MKPKLIIINGPCGIGKNTIAERYLKEHPATSIVDIDEVRRSILDYRKHREKSQREAYRLAFIKTKKCLSQGIDVVVPNKIKRSDILNTFEKIANEYNANFHEFLLWTTKKGSIERAIKRGFKPEGLLQESNLEKMYDELEEMLKKRKNVFVIDSKEGEVEKVYSEVIKLLN